MQAVFVSGGKQHRVTEGDIIKIEKLNADVDTTVEFDNVLLIQDGDSIKVGTPNLSGAKISGKVLKQGRHKKIEIIKLKRRKHYDRQMGHRQYFTMVEITKIAA